MYCMKCKQNITSHTQYCSNCNENLISISAIVPCYNEEKTVKGVIEAILSSPYIDEVIAVNDGSTDTTSEILNSFGNQISFIDLKKNKGKGYALVRGIKKSKGDIVVFLDADFINLSAKHIDLMLEPVLYNGMRGSIGYRYKNSSNISGQRVYYKNDLLPHLDNIQNTRFGVEVYLNKIFSKEEIKKVELKDILTLLKTEKYNPATALTEYIKEGLEIVKTIIVRESLSIKDKQIFAKLLEVKNENELERMIREISNIELRILLEKYILGYIRDLQKQTRLQRKPKQKNNS